MKWNPSVWKNRNPKRPQQQQRGYARASRCRGSRKLLSCARKVIKSNGCDPFTVIAVRDRLQQPYFNFHIYSEQVERELTAWFGCALSFHLQNILLQHSTDIDIEESRWLKAIYLWGGTPMEYGHGVLFRPWSYALSPERIQVHWAISLLLVWNSES